MRRFFWHAFGIVFLTMTLALSMTSPGAAQQQTWVQIEARPTLSRGQDRARSYAGRLPDVTGFAIRGGWYGVMLGPYPEAQARTVLGELRAAGRIPADSFVTDGRQFGQRFWPVGPQPGTEPETETDSVGDSVTAPGQIVISTLDDNLVVTQAPTDSPETPAQDAAPSDQPAADADASPEAGPDTGAANNPVDDAVVDAEADAALADPTVADPNVADVTPAPSPAPAPTPAPIPAPADQPIQAPTETLAEARQSEEDLGEQDRRDIQVALEWEGFYDSAIDGDFGPGTRSAMTDYQTAKGFEPTGVMTTRQRQELLENYAAVFAALGLRLMADEKAGIQMEMPMDLVEFARYEPPFAHYDAKGDRDVRIILISQTGDRGTLAGLYNIMQTLEIVPVDGERSLDDDSFVLTGQNDRLHSYSWARLSDGRIKGFSLIFPPSDARLMNVVAEGMRTTFTESSPATLDPTLGTSEEQIDLVAGLEVRRPQSFSSGFYVDGQGTVLTTAEAVQQCGRITIDELYDADVSMSDGALGLAVLRPRQSFAPPSYATFSSVSPALESEIAISGYSYDGMLGAPTLTYGTLAELRGLDGEEDRQRLSVQARSGDAGGPVFDQGGTVVGMLLNQNVGNRRLPENVFFAAKVGAIDRALSAKGVSLRKDGQIAVMAPEDLTLLASDMTVLVSCWN